MLPPIIFWGGHRVPQPTNYNHCLLRRVLARWATRFTPNEALQAHLVEKTISEALREFPAIADESSIDVELLGMMRRVVLLEFGVREVNGHRSAADTRSNSPNNDQ